MKRALLYGDFMERLYFNEFSNDTAFLSYSTLRYQGTEPISFISPSNYNYS